MHVSLIYENSIGCDEILEVACWIQIERKLILLKLGMKMDKKIGWREGENYIYAFDTDQRRMKRFNQPVQGADNHKP